MPIETEVKIKLLRTNVVLNLNNIFRIKFVYKYIVVYLNNYILWKYLKWKEKFLWYVNDLCSDIYIYIYKWIYYM